MLERGLAALAARQHGVVSRAQLLRLGFGPAAITRRVAVGRLIRLHAGVYLVGHGARPRLATEIAALLACGPGAALSHHTAAVLWRLVSRASGRSEVDVSVTRDWAPARTGVRVHRRVALEADDLTELDGLAITSPARTLLDLATWLRLDELEAAAAAAQRRHRVGRAELTDQLDRNRGRVGAARLRALVARGADPALTRSRAERRLLRLIRAAIPSAPQANRVVGGFEVDFLWPEQRLIVEFDGFAFHGDRAAFERDRIRDAELQAQGYRVIRVTWRQLADHPGAVVSRIRRALDRG
jgi:very-short-patch-repair endonuclease